MALSGSNRQYQCMMCNYVGVIDWSSIICRRHFIHREGPYDTISPPRSIPRPSTLGMWELSPGGIMLSKLMRRLASRTAAGVLVATGVRFHDGPTCAGLGDMFRNSAKFKLVDGVARPNPAKGPPPPGVDIIDDGNGVALEGGVEGACIGSFAAPARAGVGDVAKYIRRFASSSPFLPSRPSLAAPAALNPLCRNRADRATSGGGVRGVLCGDDR